MRRTPRGPSARTPVRQELLGPGRRPVTVGIVLLISMVAFEAMGVSTAMPALVADLGSVSSYAWPFVAFLAASVLATAVGGRWCDVRGAGVPLLTAPLVFGAGLVVAGTAATMTQVLVGRALQGAGAGLQGVAIYVLIAAVYPVVARPAVFGLISSAWVVPSLVGPPVAGLVTEALSWHWVFLGLVPLVGVATLLVVPATRELGPPAPGAGPPAAPGLVPAAVAAALAVAGLSWAGQALSPAAALVAAAALLALVPALRVLVPDGTLVVRRGVAAVVACRGLIAGSFFTVTAYLPLMLTDSHGWSLAAAGLPLVVGSLGWSGAAAWQGRHPDLSRPRLLRVGFVAIAVGCAGLLVVAPPWGVAWLAVPLWGLAGTGMGLGFTALSALLLSEAPPAEIGRSSSAAQLTDGLAQATFVGLGGALLAVTASTAGGLGWLLVVTTGLALLGATLSGRTRRTSRPGRARPS